MSQLRSFVSVAMLLALICAGPAVAQDKMTAAEARKIAKEAYIFNNPLVMYYRTMYLQAIDTKSKSYSGGFGKENKGVGTNVIKLSDKQLNMK